MRLQSLFVPFIFLFTLILWRFHFKGSRPAGRATLINAAQAVINVDSIQPVRVCANGHTMRDSAYRLVDSVTTNCQGDSAIYHLWNYKPVPMGLYIDTASYDLQRGGRRLIDVRVFLNRRPIFSSQHVQLNEWYWNVSVDTTFLKTLE